jgi:hypothetical protein
MSTLNKPKILSFHIVNPKAVVFSLPIIVFDPINEMRGLSFDKTSYGACNDGFTGFVRILERASAVLCYGDNKEETISQAIGLAFPTGLFKDRKCITVKERMEVLVGRMFADPVLGWSLFVEEGQKTLRWIHDVFGILQLEFLRRIFYEGSGVDHRDRFAFCLYRNYEGSWRWHCDNIENRRNNTSHALCF